MNDQDFKKIRKEFDEMATRELDDRGPSYAEDEDRLANFKVLGHELGITAMQVLMVYLKKHMRSIERYVRDGHQTSGGVITNFVGVRNYLDLAVALMKDLQSPEPKGLHYAKCINCGHENAHESITGIVSCGELDCYCQN